ncbi:MAG: hypothetical protein AAF092_06725 [Pseudomonadota bacterium]
MKKLTLTAAATAMALTMATAKPAQSQDLLVTIGGAALIGAGVIYFSSLSNTNLVTSANTDYALTGRGTPTGYLFENGAARTQSRVAIECNPNGSNCRTVTTSGFSR